MSSSAAQPADRLDPAKFRDPDATVDGAPRASVALDGLATLWFNTGSLCNLTCRNCYMESSPTNDSLAYLSAAEVAAYLDELDGLGGLAGGAATHEIGFTGGEPFMNPEIMEMLTGALGRGFRVLVLTNAMRPMQRHRTALAALGGHAGARLTLRVSLDHYTADLHELERGPGSWRRTLAGLRWLIEQDIAVTVAGRTCWGEGEAQARAGYGRLIAELGLDIDADDPAALVLFPEMDETLDVPEISQACWSTLGVDPAGMMCASARMVVKRRGADGPVVVPCTLLPYDEAFEMGRHLAGAMGAVKLNHPHCARFCVLGGGRCSAPKLATGARVAESAGAEAGPDRIA